MPGVSWESPEPVYRTVIGFVLGVFKAMDWRVRVFDSEHVPSSGPAVIASNHIGYLDFVFVGFGAREQGRLVRFMAKQEVFEHPVAGPLMRGMKHIPVDRYGKARDAVEESIDRLRKGQIVGMFPEGTISPSFVPREGKTGAARMAIEAGAPLIPAATWGTQRILTKWRPKNFQRGVAIDVHYGDPIDTGHGDPERATKELMEAIGGLVDRAAERYPQDPADDDDRWWLPIHLGGTAPTPDAAEKRLAEQRARVRREREQRGQQEQQD